MHEQCRVKSSVYPKPPCPEVEAQLQMPEGRLSRRAIVRLPKAPHSGSGHSLALLF